MLIAVMLETNIHMDEDELYSKHFKDIFNLFNYIQHVNFAIHTLGHTLDIVATMDTWTYTRHCGNDGHLDIH